MERKSSALARNDCPRYGKYDEAFNAAFYRPAGEVSNLIASFKPEEIAVIERSFLSALKVMNEVTVNLNEK